MNGVGASILLVLRVTGDETLLMCGVVNEMSVFVVAIFGCSSEERTRIEREYFKLLGSHYFWEIRTDFCSYEMLDVFDKRRKKAGWILCEFIEYFQSWKC